MENNNLFSIWIPTYNRSCILDESLCHLIPIVKKYKITIGIINNASTDNTDSIVKKYRDIYENISYYVNNNNIGGDLNILECYLHSTTNYTCVLGDSYRINADVIDSILRILTADQPDLLVINRGGIENIPSQQYSDISSFIYDIGGSLDLTGTLVTKKEAVNPMFYNRYVNTHFIHVGLNIEYLCSLQSAKISWLRESHIYGTSLNRLSNSWISESARIFLQGWTIMCFGLPSQISVIAKEHMIRMHEELYPCFSFKSIIFCIYNRVYSPRKIREVKRYLPFSTNHNCMYFYFLYLFMPHWLLKICLNCYQIPVIKKIYRFFKYGY